MSKAEEFAALHLAMCEDKRYGYSQWPCRWGEDGEIIQLGGHSVKSGSFDCSSSTIYAAIACCIPVGDANYTGDMRREFQAHGWICLPYDPSILEVGDVILNEGSHVAVYQGDWAMSEFRHNEFGGIYNGQTGDQTSDEARLAKLRDFGQQWILRYRDEPATIDGAVYRLYNPYAGWHHFTTDAAEVNEIIRLGWNYEGAAWTAPETGQPVWRLCNPWTGEHIWTAKSSEHDELMGSGWEYEGVAFKSNGSVPVHRLYNPSNGAHHYTTNMLERNAMVIDGWTDEGEAFRAVA